MKVASFNVNSIRVRLPLVLEWLRQNRPDVLAVQETKVQDTKFPEAAFEKAGYRCAFRGQKGYNGVALIAVPHMSDMEFGLPTQPRDEARLVKARIGDVTFVNTYVPQGYLPASDRFQYKLEWFNRLLDYFRSTWRPTDLVLWMGDLNVAPLPIDVYDPVRLQGHVCHRPEVRSALERVVQWGLIDVFRKHCPEPGQYTYWDYRPGNPFKHNHGWRLDHILATAPLAQRSVACSIDKAPRAAERPSDHTPIVAEFDL
ncbi:MAG: exodeoxyribonuclease III [Sedimentisphaerales bacterium]|nr:exodeoxyribonuclease III [Sedimentisphaerales bacterium]